MSNCILDKYVQSDTVAISIQSINTQKLREFVHDYLLQNFWMHFENAEEGVTVWNGVCVAFLLFPR